MAAVRDIGADRVPEDVIYDTPRPIREVGVASRVRGIVGQCGVRGCRRTNEDQQIHLRIRSWDCRFKGDEAQPLSDSVLSPRSVAKVSLLLLRDRLIPLQTDVSWIFVCDGHAGPLTSAVACGTAALDEVVPAEGERASKEVPMKLDSIGTFLYRAGLSVAALDSMPRSVDVCALPFGDFIDFMVGYPYAVLLLDAVVSFDISWVHTSHGRWPAEVVGGSTALGVAFTDRSIVTMNVGDSRAVAVYVSKQAEEEAVQAEFDIYAQVPQSEGEELEVSDRMRQIKLQKVVRSVCWSTSALSPAITKLKDIYSRRVVPLSVDQKPSLPSEKRRIEAAGGLVVNNRLDGSLGLSRSLGDFGFKSDGRDYVVLPLDEECFTPACNMDVEQAVAAAVKRVTPPLAFVDPDEQALIMYESHEAAQQHRGSRSDNGPLMRLPDGRYISGSVTDRAIIRDGALATFRKRVSEAAVRLWSTKHMRVTPVPTIERHDATDLDYVVVACDGYWDVFSSDEGMVIVLKIAERLVPSVLPASSRLSDMVMAMEAAARDIGYLAANVAVDFGSTDNVAVSVVIMQNTLPGSMWSIVLQRLVDCVLHRKNKIEVAYEGLSRDLFATDGVTDKGRDQWAHFVDNVRAALGR